ncbi:unnamed protein product [Tilletia controversa]|uniref:Uncharacterized protein n=1 Tax=Tilletia controversa TaxID=13291 RepID=A0A8X7MXK1_9BASI|nr:hypothetical protein A4X06_0g1422 [Tilletia controversa]CAD6898342.1 unnamed protein product [Tilletia controversa]
MARINSGTTASEVFRVFAALEICDAPPAYRTQLYVTVPIVVVILAVLLHSIWSRYKERSLWIFRIQKTHCGKTLWVCNNIYMTVAVGIIYFILSYTLAWVEVFYISHHQVWRGVTRTIQWIPLFSAAWFSMLGTFRAAPGFTSRIFPGNTQLARYLSHELDKINNILLVAGPVILTLVQGPIAVMAVIRRREALNQLHEVLAELAALPVKHRLDERQAALATQVMSSFEKAMGLEELSLLLYGVFSGAGIVGMASLCIFMIKHLRREMNRELSLVGFGLMSVVCRSQNHTQQLITHPILDAAAIEAEK